MNDRAESLIIGILNSSLYLKFDFATLLQQFLYSMSLVLVHIFVPVKFRQAFFIQTDVVPGHVAKFQQQNCQL